MSQRPNAATQQTTLPPDRAQPRDRRWVVLCLIIGALLVSIPAHAAEGVAAQAAAVPAPAPAEARDAPDAAHLRAILAAAPGKKRRALAFVVDLDSGAVILDVRGDEPAYPASVAKLFTTAAAVRTFRGDERLITRVLAGGRRQSGAATLAIVGVGDPSLSIKDLGALADKVVAAGITEVATLVVDHTLFDDALPRGFKEKNTDATYRAPIDALEVNGSSIAIAVRPGARQGDRITVEVTPACDAVRVIDQASTGPGRKSTIAVRTRPAGKFTEVLVTGTIGVDRKVVGAGRRRVADAGFFADEVFRALLIERGVRIAAETAYRSAGDGLDVVATHSSETVDSLLAFCNKWSNNLYAETFYKLVGARGASAQATGEIAERMVLAKLTEVGLNTTRLKLGNGSGLYHADQFSTRQVTQVLAGMAASPEFGRYRATLAVAGVDGTLRRRLAGAATKGKIFAKTGTLDDVTALAGYALGPHRRYAFALLFNDVAGSAGTWRRIHDRFVTALVNPDASEAETTKKPRQSKPAAAPQRKATRKATPKAKRRARSTNRVKKR